MAQDPARELRPEEDTEMKISVLGRVLHHDFGLKLGVDYSTTGWNFENVRRGTIVNLFTAKANEALAARADHFEQVMEAEGHPFKVSIHHSRDHANGGYLVRCDVKNFGTRVREDELKPPRAKQKTNGEVMKAFPRGTRVLALDSHGVHVPATVNGLEVGIVQDPDHINYQRAYVGVTWDPRPHNDMSKLRACLFVDSVLRMDDVFTSRISFTKLLGATFVRPGVHFTRGVPTQYPVLAEVTATDEHRRTVSFDVRDPFADAIVHVDDMPGADFREGWVL